MTIKQEIIEKYTKEGFRWVYLEEPIGCFGLVMTEKDMKDLNKFQTIDEFKNWLQKTYMNEEPLNQADIDKIAEEVEMMI